MGANSFLNDWEDHDLEDANARWRAYVSLMRRTGATGQLSGLDDGLGPSDEQAWPRAAGDGDGWADAKDQAVFFDEQTGHAAHADRADKPNESLETSSAERAGLVLDQPAPLRRRASVYWVAGAFLCLTGFSIGVLHPGRRDEPPQFETWPKPQPVGRAPSQPLLSDEGGRATEKAAEGVPVAAASAQPVAMALTHDIRREPRPAAGSHASVRRHAHRAHVRLHAKRVCAHCRTEADDAPHAPLPPIWPDGKTLDVPSSP